VLQIPKDPVRHCSKPFVHEKSLVFALPKSLDDSLYLAAMEKVLFRGTKTFWKTKNRVEIAVIDHRDFDVLEVVAFEPVLQVEAPRIYVDAQVLRHILTVDDQNGELKNGQSSIIASGPDPMGKFVFNHLFITTFLPSSKKFVVEVRRGYRPAAEHVDEEGLIVARPAHLIPCQAPFESAPM
jgi:hypothetical protein